MKKNTYKMGVALAGSSLLLSTSCVSFSNIREISEVDDPIDYIDPMIGATSEKFDGELTCGKTFPGAATPFGAIQLSPDTYTGDDVGPGYSHHHTTIEGFSWMHLSGIGAFGEFGNFLVMPTVGDFYPNKGKEEDPDAGYRSRYSHDSETAVAGYYAVMLDDYSIRAEMTATPRVGLLRFTFPESDQSRIQIDFSRRIGGRATKQHFQIEGDRAIRGWIDCDSSGGGWMHGKRLTSNLTYRAHIYAEFSKPFIKTGGWQAKIPEDFVCQNNEMNSDEYRGWVKKSKVVEQPGKMLGRHIGFFSEFSSEEGDEVLMKASVSFVSAPSARNNVKAELPHWDFEKVKNDAQNLWREAADGIYIKGASEKQKTIFYTSLYHMKIDPRTFSDANGSYRGADKKVHKTEGFTYRSVFSGWDVFRSQFPLLTIIDPEVVNDEVNSLVEMASVGGKGYPRWELASQYTSCMLGDPAIPVIVDAYKKGIRNFDVEKAYALGKDTTQGPDTIREGWEDFNKLHYIPVEATKQAVSATLENVYPEWCMYEWAKELGKDDDAAFYRARAYGYTNIYDSVIGWMRPKKRNGEFVEKWKGKLKHWQGTIECNPFQQSFFVPHDVQGLINLMGAERFEKELTEMFEKVPEDYAYNDYYNHSNEPVHHIPYLFAYIGKPWMTQKYVREIMDKAYGLGPRGLCGNEDVGQMSAWYVFNAMGFHPVAPGDNVYVFGSPLFREVEIRLNPKYHSGKTFKVVAKNNSKENCYIQSVRLNGKTLHRAWITHDEVISGGVLEFEMGPDPNKEFGADPVNFPPSMTVR
jgi:predicted alpha-1,2-mannosidase